MVFYVDENTFLIARTTFFLFLASLLTQLHAALGAQQWLILVKTMMMMMMMMIKTIKTMTMTIMDSDDVE